MYWSDVTTDTIHRSSIDGQEEELLANTNLIAVGMFSITAKSLLYTYTL